MSERVRSQRLNYGQVTRVVAPAKPNSHPFVGIAAQIDPASNSIKPSIIWVESSQFPQRKEFHLLTLRGDSEIEFPNHHSFRFLFTTHDANRRTGGIATVWLCEPERQPVTPPTPPPRPKPPTPHSPESLAARAAAEERERLKRQQEEELKNNEIDPDDLLADLEDKELIDEST